MKFEKALSVIGRGFFMPFAEKIARQIPQKRMVVPAKRKKRQGQRIDCENRKQWGG